MAEPRGEPTKKGEASAVPRPPAWGVGTSLMLERLNNSFSPASNTDLLSFVSVGQIQGTRTPDAHDRVLQALSGLTGLIVTIQTQIGEWYEGTVGSTSGMWGTTGVILNDVTVVSTFYGLQVLQSPVFMPYDSIDTLTPKPADTKTIIVDGTSNANQGEAPAVRSRPLWPPYPLDSHDRVLDALSRLIRFTVTLRTKTGQCYEGTVSIVYPWHDTTPGVLLLNVKDVSTPGATAQEVLFIARTDIDTWTSDSADNKTIIAESTPPFASKPETPPATATAVSTAVNNTVAPVNEARATQHPALVPTHPDGESETLQRTLDNPLPRLRDFVLNERPRVVQTRAALVKREMDKRMVDLLKFSQTFKVDRHNNIIIGSDEHCPMLAQQTYSRRLNSYLGQR
ncbi:hypothetical protein JAAARDRAFT_646472 [Jaapia argillacea MUCL 33604]|uniref:Uncharacterized protein n=1 Tax=Jaapia argillacea MUCL 33604 TaxID=933084 RepID=A0A067PVU4_9AGAM|nr:hypothetical protein JAAARDRAFT_646472 [Jaapia argillacea MUCL 33604]